MSYDEDEFRQDLEADSDWDEKVTAKSKKEADELDFLEKDDDEEEEEKPAFDGKPHKYRCLDCKATFTTIAGLTAVCPKCGALAKQVDENAPDLTDEEPVAKGKKAKGEKEGKGGAKNAKSPKAPAAKSKKPAKAEKKAKPAKAKGKKR